MKISVVTVIYIFSYSVFYLFQIFHDDLLIRTIVDMTDTATALTLAQSRLSVSS